MIRPVNLCEVDRRDEDGGTHLCGRTAGHAGDHVCDWFHVCGVAWGRVEVIRADHLGPCDACREPVRPLEECSTCLEEHGVARHAEACCDD